MKEFIKKYYLRFIVMLIGTVLIGISAAMYVVSTIGSNSINTFCFGITELLKLIFKKDISTSIGITVGNAILAIILLIFGRKYLNVGTIVAVVLIGPVCGLFVDYGILKANDNLFMCYLYSIVATILNSLGASMIIKANVGTSPYDGVSLVLNDIIPIKFWIIRIIYDAVLFGLGFLMGSVIGWGCVIAVVLTGPLISIFNKLIDIIMKSKAEKVAEEESESIENKNDQ